MIDRAHYPRVTQVLRMVPKAFLQHWVAFEERKRMVTMAERLSIPKLRKWVQELPRCTDTACQCASGVVLTDAGEKGTEFHQAVYDYLEHREPKVTGSQYAFKRFLKWFAKQDMRIRQKELGLYSNVWRYKGTTDVIFERPGIDGLFIGDWKTSNNPDPTHELQIGAYAGAYLEMNGLDWGALAGGLVVRFDKREKAPRRTIDEHWLTRDELQERFKVFTSLRRPYDFALSRGLLKVGD